MRRVVAVLVCLGVIASACGDDDDVAAIEDYPDAIRRELDRLAAEPRPVPNSALPPRHLDEDRFPTALVDRTQIVSGGPPADGIASIDAPVFVPVASVDWLEPQEAVLSLALDREARAYPISIMTAHEIANDVVAGVPIAITYCPLCSSGVAFDRRLDGTVLEFGTSGSVYRSALVMYDRTTETLWTHFDGRAVVGDLAGAQLDLIPLATVAWADFAVAHPDGKVLSAPDPSRYGRNRYPNYDSRDAPLDAFFRGELDPRLAPMTRVVGLRDGDAVLAVDRALVEAEVVWTGALRTDPVVVWHRPGAASALDAPTVAAGGDIGAVGAFFADEPFTPSADGFTDAATGSTWNVLGVATGGPRRGEQLTPVTHLDTFWFAWAANHPSTELAAPPVP